MTDLLRTLETAEAGSRELSDEVLLALGWHRHAISERLIVGPSGHAIHVGDAPSPTESVDDALALDETDTCFVRLERFEGGYRCVMRLGSKLFLGVAKKKALAVCTSYIALVRAHQATNKETDGE